MNISAKCNALFRDVSTGALSAPTMWRCSLRLLLHLYNDYTFKKLISQPALNVGQAPHKTVTVIICMDVIIVEQ